MFSRKQLENLEKGIHSSSVEEKKKNRVDKSEESHRFSSYDENRYRRKDRYRDDDYKKDDRRPRDSGSSHGERKRDYSERSVSSSSRSGYHPKFKDEPRTPKYSRFPSYFFIYIFYNFSYIVLFMSIA